MPVSTCGSKGLFLQALITLILSTPPAAPVSFLPRGSGQAFYGNPTARKSSSFIVVSDPVSCAQRGSFTARVTQRRGRLRPAGTSGCIERLLAASSGKRRALLQSTAPLDNLPRTKEDGKQKRVIRWERGGGADKNSWPAKVRNTQRACAAVRSRDLKVPVRGATADTLAS